MAVNKGKQRQQQGGGATAGGSKGANSSSNSRNEPARTYVVSKIDAGQAVLISDQVGGKPVR